MAKNIIIAVAAFVIIGIGGWFVFGRMQHASAPGPTTSGQAKVLDYSNQNLVSVGPGIYGQTDATQLILSHNDVRSLPSQMGNMDRLHVLKVDHNQLQGALIAEIRKMPLVTLDASYNDMTGIPAEIGQLDQLQTLNYSHNRISTLPDELANLKQLKTLDLTGNPLSAGQISQLRAKLPDTTILF